MQVWNLHFFRQCGFLDPHVFAGNVILNHNPAVFLAEDLNPIIGGNGCFSVTATQIILAGAGIDRIFLSTREFDFLSIKITSRYLGRITQRSFCLSHRLRYGRQTHISQIPLKRSINTTRDFKTFAAFKECGNTILYEHMLISSIALNAVKVPYSFLQHKTNRKFRIVVRCVHLIYAQKWRWRFSHSIVNAVYVHGKADWMAILR